MSVDTKIKNLPHTLIMTLLTPFLFIILLVVEIKSFYIPKFSLLLQFQIKNVVDIGTKRTISDTYKPVQLYGRYKPKLYFIKLTLHNEKVF